VLLDLKSGTGIGGTSLACEYREGEGCEYRDGSEKCDRRGDGMLAVLAVVGVWVTMMFGGLAGACGDGVYRGSDSKGFEIRNPFSPAARSACLPNPSPAP
jgi:hypothetical protein